MKITCFGHAAVGLENSQGTGILFDPYLPGAFEGRFRYGAIPGEFDVVIISHEHVDHSHVAPSFGNPVVVRESTQVMGLDIEMVPAPHGTNLGTMDTTTMVSRVEVDGMVVVHPGDIGPPVADELVARLKGTDILFVPVGGRFTFNSAEAVDFVRRIAPRVVIPIHYKTPANDLPLLPPDGFLEAMTVVREFPDGQTIVDANSLPESTEAWHLAPQCQK